MVVTAPPQFRRSAGFGGERADSEVEDVDGDGQADLVPAGGQCEGTGARVAGDPVARRGAVRLRRCGGRRTRQRFERVGVPGDVATSAWTHHGGSVSGRVSLRARSAAHRWPPGPGTPTPRPGTRSPRQLHRHLRPSDQDPVAVHRHATGSGWGDPGPSVPRHIPWSHRVRRRCHLRTGPRRPPLAARPVRMITARAGVVPEGERSTTRRRRPGRRRHSAGRYLPPPTDSGVEHK